MSLDERFKKAVWLVRNGPPKDSSNETKLSFYKYYKQATEGDVTGAQVSSTLGIGPTYNCITSSKTHVAVFGLSVHLRGEK
jgi:hypothetical protein